MDINTISIALERTIGLLVNCFLGYSTGATTFSITTLSIKALSIMGLFATLSITRFSIITANHNILHGNSRFFSFCKFKMNEVAYLNPNPKKKPT
jgi:hypothetical protein